jgi:hypothetical protein
VPTSWNDRARRLREDAGSPIETWRPQKPGDEAVGVLVRYEETVLRSGRRVLRLVLAQEGGGRAMVWASHTKLRSELERLRPRVGEMLLVRFEGERVGENGRAYFDYTLRGEGSLAAEPDWASYQGDAPQPDVPSVGASDVDVRADGAGPRDVPADRQR